MTRADLLCDALDGLVRLAWHDRVAALQCEGPEDLLPTTEERDAWGEVLALADVLVAGSDGKRREKSDLGTVARVLAAMSGVIGVVQFLGQRYETVLDGGRLRLRVEAVS